MDGWNIRVLKREGLITQYSSRAGIVKLSNHWDLLSCI